jgi:hypothetical protein
MDRWKLVEQYLEDLYDLHEDIQEQLPIDKFNRAKEVGRKAQIKALRRSAIKQHETLTVGVSVTYYLRTRAKARLGRKPTTVCTHAKVLYL